MGEKLYPVALSARDIDYLLRSGLVWPQGAVEERAYDRITLALRTAELTTDEALIREAEIAGKVQKVGVLQSGIPQEPPTRFKHPAKPLVAPNGMALLAKLGLLPQGVTYHEPTAVGTAGHTHPLKERDPRCQ